MKIIGIFLDEADSGCLGTVGAAGALMAILLPIGLAINFWDSHPIMFSILLGVAIAIIAMRLIKRFCKGVNNGTILVIGALIVAIVTVVMFNAFSMGTRYDEDLCSVKLDGQLIEIAPKRYKGITLYKNWKSDCFIVADEYTDWCPQVTYRVLNDIEGTLTVRLLGYYDMDAQKGQIELTRTDTGETVVYEGFYIQFDSYKDIFIPAQAALEWYGFTFKKIGSTVELWTN